MVREQADTDTAGNIEHMTLNLEFAGHLTPDPLCSCRHAGDIARVNQREYKLVSSDLSHRVLRAGMFVQTFSDLLQKRVANRMSQRVVDGLEVIKVEPPYGDRLSPPSGIAYRLGQPVLKK